MSNQDDYSFPLFMSGHISTLPVEEPSDVIERLHQAVKDVTGVPVQPPAEKPRMGFLP